jgi:DNA polymerase I-like protein with 3'-5' exonuclease and polymerase domains
VKRGIPYNTLESDSLVKLKKLGVVSPVLDARLAWAATDTFRRYVAPLRDAARVHPTYLPTQASGRWSVTNPPLINFPDAAKAAKRGLPDLQACFLPDIGTWWLCSDWDAMHARFMAGMSDDAEDLKAFNERLDIHTITTCRIFHLPLPPSWREADIHGGDACADWRGRVSWAGKGDRRRHLAKTTRYSLLNAYDEKGVLEAKDIEELNVTPEELLKVGREFLRAKPNMVAFKQNYCRAAIAAGEARSLLGRRRKLFGSDYRDKFKLAIAHFLQGTEVDIMESTILEVLQVFPEARLAWPSHDGLKFVFPTLLTVEDVFPRAKAIVEKPWRIGKHDIPLYATWEVVRDDGSHLKL